MLCSAEKSRTPFVVLRAHILEAVRLVDEDVHLLAGQVFDYPFVVEFEDLDGHQEPADVDVHKAALGRRALVLEDVEPCPADVLYLRQPTPPLGDQ
jgi:hypothetical protein